MLLFTSDRVKGRYAGLAGSHFSGQEGMAAESRLASIGTGAKVGRECPGLTESCRPHKRSRLPFVPGTMAMFT